MPATFCTYLDMFYNFANFIVFTAQTLWSTSQLHTRYYSYPVFVMFFKVFNVCSGIYCLLLPFYWVVFFHCLLSPSLSTFLVHYCAMPFLCELLDTWISLYLSIYLKMFFSKFYFLYYLIFLMLWPACFVHCILELQCTSTACSKIRSILFFVGFSSAETAGKTCLELACRMYTNNGQTNYFHQNISQSRINKTQHAQRASTDSLKTMRVERQKKDELQVRKLNINTHTHTHTLNDERLFPELQIKADSHRNLVITCSAKLLQRGERSRIADVCQNTLGWFLNSFINPFMHGGHTNATVDLPLGQAPQAFQAPAT